MLDTAAIRALVREVLREEVLPALRDEIRAALGGAQARRTDEDRHLKTEDAAAVAGVKPATIRAWIDEGRLPAHRGPGGREWRVRQSDLARVLNGQDGAGAASVTTEAAAERLLSAYAGKMKGGGT